MVIFYKHIDVIIISLFMQLTLFALVLFLKKRGIKSNYFAKQKIHEGEVPRVGGLLFLSSFFVSHIFIEFDYLSLIFPLMIGTSIIFIFSFYEDLKQSLSPIFRLLIMCFGALIFIYPTDLPEINISILEFIKIMN